MVSMLILTAASGVMVSMLILTAASCVMVSMLILTAASGVMVSMLILTAVDPGFNSQSAHTKDYKISICCSAKHTALRSKNKD